MPAVSSPVSSLSAGKRLCQFFQKYFLCFVFYSVFGWCYEVFLEVVVYRWGFSNRGVLFGPYCPVYGVGALSPRARGRLAALLAVLIGIDLVFFLVGVFS